MWLLNTKTLRLKEVTRPHRAKYATLSHVWEDSDRTQTFQDIRAIHARCVLSGEDPLSLVTEKVRRFCLFAERAGYEWVWLDTCCIDKSSSAELSEAINSMYAWYRDARVCYAYLCDVDDDDDPRSPDSGFRRSRWHTRGWTLQELIAPPRVVFLSRGWLTIGSRVALVDLLAEISGIDRALLAGRPSVTCESFSIARRMSWASKRMTTRAEDHAYCLMGLFGITMTVIYGEGETRAFARLQAEILRTSYDDSIFAWGPIHPNLAFFDRGRLFIEPEHIPTNPADNDDAHILSVSRGQSGSNRDSLPLATSPSAFASSSDYLPFSGSRDVPVEATGTNGQFTFTSRGLTIGVPISVDPLPVEGATDDPTVQSDVYVAVLRCSKSSGTNSLHSRHPDKATFVVLFLTEMSPSPGKAEGLGSPAGKGYYRVGAKIRTAGGLQFLRGAVVRTLDADAVPPSTFVMREAIILDQSRTQHLAPGRPLYPRPHLGARGRFQFHIPSWSLRRMQTQHGFSLQDQGYLDDDDDGATVTVTAQPVGPSPDSSRAVPVLSPNPVTFRFVNHPRNEVLTIRIGLDCSCEHAVWPASDNWWIEVDEARADDPPGTHARQYVPRGPPPAKRLVGFGGSVNGSALCKRRHLCIRPLNRDGRQHVAFDLGDRTVHVETTLSLFPRWHSLTPPVMLMIALEGFDTLAPAASVSPNISSNTLPLSSAEGLQDHPHSSSIPSWLSRSLSSLGLPLPGTPRFIPPLPGVSPLKDWLASEVDFTYGSLV